MNSVKEEAKRALETLPENATWDDIMYQLYVREKISCGLKDVEEGRVISHEIVKKQFRAG